MGYFTPISVENDLNQTMAAFFRRLLKEGIVAALLVPCRQPHRNTVMQTLVYDPDCLDGIDPFAPVVPTNSARLVASLTRNSEAPVAAVLRSCEVRAFLELLKLNQGRADNLLLLGIDCFGRFENRDFLALAEKDPNLTLTFLDEARREGEVSIQGKELALACRICEYPVAEGVDIRIGMIGTDPRKALWLEWTSEKGRSIAEQMGVESQEKGPEGRERAVESLVEQRLARRESVFGAMRERTKDMAGLAEVVAACINCYNCRVACPVCYCRECVFMTDTFRHDGAKYLQWALNRGKIKMPTDTTFYHLTRMLHISTLCVGCGQCSSACPNDIPVMELFRSVAERTQARFSYQPGRSLDEKQPMAVFYGEEFGEVTGQSK